MVKTKTIEDLKGVYFLYGGEKYLVDEAISRLKTIIEKGGDLTLNLERFTAPRDVSDILNACFTPPFLSQKRLVIVEEIERLAPSDRDRLVDYVENPMHHTVLIMVQTGLNKSKKPNIDKRTKLFKKCDKLGYVYEYKIEQKNIKYWIKDEFLKRNKVPTDQVVQLLGQIGANDLRRLSSEIEKISLYADGTKKIDMDHIREVISLSAEAEVFDLIEKVVAGDVDSSLDLLAVILDEDDEVGKIFYLLEQQISLLLKGKEYHDKGIPDKEMAGLLRISPGRLYYLKTQLRSVSIENLKNMLELLARADHRRKQSLEDNRLILERFIVDAVATRSEVAS